VGRAEEDAAGIDQDGPALGKDRHRDGWHAAILDDRPRYSSVVEHADGLTGRLVAVHVTALGAIRAGGSRLPPGRLAVVLVIDGVPVGDLPTGARLRVGVDAMVAVGPPGSASGPGDATGGILEVGETQARAAAALEGGLVEPGDAVTLEAVTLPTTDVLDLHSFRPEDVPAVVSEYLEEARRGGILEVRIVHGRGRGVQRAVVRRLLANAPGVIEFADASPARGGWGATLVRLSPAERASAE
jgi:hypothetical protein